MDTLKCYKCLNLECPEGGRGEKNEILCQSARSFITKSLNLYYEFGPTGFIGNCPAQDETLQWTILQQSSDNCPLTRESATCSLGRLQIVSEQIGNINITADAVAVTSHATILGCAKLALLRYIKESTSSPHTCSIYRQNNTGENSYLLHHLMLENCPKVTDYCNSRNYCIPFQQSIVKLFQTGKDDRSFETGIIISIIAIIVVLLLVAIIATSCNSPLSRSTNYSPAHVRITTAIEIQEID